MGNVEGIVVGVGLVIDVEILVYYGKACCNQKFCFSPTECREILYCCYLLGM